MKKAVKWFIPVFIILLLAGSFLVYAGIFYHADATALAALESDDAVSVTPASYGWFFDGPSAEDVLIFYPGAKVEETAYAPLLHELAGKGMDVCLVKMPFRFAFFGTDKADAVIRMYDYEHCYIGGHSLGGAMAAEFAAGHSDQLTGLILLAAFPTKQISDELLEISIYGSEDRVLNMAKIEAGRALAPADYFEYRIEGGNHAQFGNYGVQKGDGAAAITGPEQQQSTVDFIIQHY